MSDDKNNQKTHYFFEGDDNLHEIIKKANGVAIVGSSRCWWRKTNYHS